jgi:hypothetical protein
MIHTIFPANRKRLRGPAFVTVRARDDHPIRGGFEYIVYWSREERAQARNWRLNSRSNKRYGELYFINVYPTAVAHLP